MRLQPAQNKCIILCSKLNDRSSIKSKDFEKINWLLIHERISQCTLCSVYNFFTKNCPTLMRHVPLESSGVHTRSSYQKLNVPHRKIYVGQKALQDVQIYKGRVAWSLATCAQNLKVPGSSTAASYV